MFDFLCNFYFTCNVNINEELKASLNLKYSRSSYLLPIHSEGKYGLVNKSVCRNQPFSVSHVAEYSAK